MCAPGRNLEADLHSCPGGAVAKIFTGAAQAQGMLQGLTVKLLPKVMPSSSFRHVSSCTSQQAEAYSPETQGKITYRMQLKLIMNTVINKVLIRTQKPFSHSNSCQLLWGW